MNTVSVIIVSYYTGPALMLALESALVQPECKEVILVDNGNTPGDRAQLAQLAATHAPRLRIVTQQENVGFARGCNVGARGATGDYILLLNPDSMLYNDSLKRALEAMKQFPLKTLAGCYLLNPDGTEQRGCRRALLNPINALVESLGLYYFFNLERLNYHQTPLPQDAHEIPAISGAFMLIARAFYEELQGLDEGYFLHMEDMDLCYRVHEAGGKVICMPHVPVLHFRSTSEAASATVECYKTKGFIRYLRTHFGTKSPFMIQMMVAGIWVRYVLKLMFQTLDRLFVPPLEGKEHIARLVRLYRQASFAPQTQELAGKTLVVTGPSGQIGLQLIGKALARGAQVIALYNSMRLPFEHPRLRWVQQDLLKDISIAEDIKADVFIHTPALWFLPDVLEVLAKKTGAKRLIAFSSTSVVGKKSSKNSGEQEGIKKLLQAEEDVFRISKKCELKTTLLRPTMIYGVGLDRNISRLAYVVKRFGFLPIYPPAKGFRHPVQSADLADAVLSILDKEATYGKTYNLGGKDSISYRAMLEQIFTYIGKPLLLIPIPLMPQVLNALGFLYQMKHINGEMARRMNKDLVFDISDAVRDFGYQPHGFLEGDVVL